MAMQPSAASSDLPSILIQESQPKSSRLFWVSQPILLITVSKITEECVSLDDKMLDIIS